MKPFIVLSTGQSSYMYQLFVGKDEFQNGFPTVYDLLKKSLLESKISFKNMPEVLILQMPRVGAREKVFEQIIPSPILEITEFVDNGRNF